jgi:tetratricopeptide (TPR) repeat protein
MTNDARAAARQAEALRNQAHELSDSGDEDRALALYLESLVLDSADSQTHYNVGLIYKYRRDWAKSLRHNERAVQLQPEDEASHWNLAIAATALRDWATARAVWHRLGTLQELGEGPIDEDFGSTPVRLNWDAGDDLPIEVVWARRVCPVRARILNIPTPATRFRYGDLVLNDGAAEGYRLDAEGREKPVFNVLELWEHSAFATFDVALDAASAQDIEALEAICDRRGFPCQDWTGTLRMLCKACSEGRPHEQHDHELKPDGWAAARRVGIASMEEAAVHAALEEWVHGGERRRVSSVECEVP